MSSIFYFSMLSFSHWFPLLKKISFSLFKTLGSYDVWGSHCSQLWHWHPDISFARPGTILPDSRGRTPDFLNHPCHWQRHCGLSPKPSSQWLHLSFIVALGTQAGRWGSHLTDKETEVSLWELPSQRSYKSRTPNSSWWPFPQTSLGRSLPPVSGGWAATGRVWTPSPRQEGTLGYTLQTVSGHCLAVRKGQAILPLCSLGGITSPSDERIDLYDFCVPFGILPVFHFWISYA